MFVGSAGAYKDKGIEPMHVEGDERKSSAGHVAVEKYLAEQVRTLLPRFFIPNLDSDLPWRNTW